MSRNLNRCPTHPGELLREDVLPEVKKSKAEISRLLGISRQHLHDILAERTRAGFQIVLGFHHKFATRKAHDEEKALGF